MNLRSALKRSLDKLPPWLATVLGFAFVIAFGFAAASFLPPARDLRAECRERCGQRFSRVVPDVSRPMSAKGTREMVCECY